MRNAPPPGPWSLLGGCLVGSAIVLLAMSIGIDQGAWALITAIPVAAAGVTIHCKGANAGACSVPGHEHFNCTESE